MICRDYFTLVLANCLCFTLIVQTWEEECGVKCSSSSFLYDVFVFQKKDAICPMNWFALWHLLSTSTSIFPEDDIVLPRHLNCFKDPG